MTDEKLSRALSCDASRRIAQRELAARTMARAGLSPTFIAEVLNLSLKQAKRISKEDITTCV